MQTGRKRALIACLDANDTLRYAAALSAAGYYAPGAVYSAREVLPALRAHQPQLLLAQAVLPGGDGIALSHDIAGASLNIYPHVLLTAPPGLRLPGSDDLDGLGAALIPGPVTAEAIARAVSVLEARAHLLPKDGASKLRALMDRLGVPVHPGREMLAHASALVWRDRSRLENLRDRVYPDAARPLGKTGPQAERAIRHVIEAAWRTGEIDEQQRIFGDTIDARRGRPTCGEMIAQLADILRWEG